jgi:hypothetical protein
MTVVSSAEFAANQQKYFDLAIDKKEVYVEYGNNMLMVCNANRQEEPMIFEPDEDFYRSISAEEFRVRLVEVVEKLDKKYASNHHA